MSKAVMISIRPKWVEKIANGEKTIEVRRTCPKLATPFKCYIYCTGGVGKDVIKNIAYRWNGTRLIKRHVDKGWLKDNPEQTWQILLDYGFTHPIHKGDYELNGKVIGEFVCDEIDDLSFVPTKYFGTVPGTWEKLVCEQSCLSVDEIKDYKGSKKAYGWHISSLKIYDEPKELKEFVASTPNSKFKAHGDNLKRPFQSWGYVQELN